MKSFHKRFKEKVVALEDITLHFCKGEIIALVGGNASGKTTLFRILTGVNRPTSGEARLMGCNTRYFVTGHVATQSGQNFYALTFSFQQSFTNVNSKAIFGYMQAG